MLTTQEITLLTNVAQAVGQSAEYITAQYTAWELTNAWGWILFGLMICGSIKWLKFNDQTSVEQWGQHCIRLCIFIFGALFIFSNFADAINPQAPAIHTLIKSVTPK